MAGMHALFACLRKSNVKNGEKLTVFKALVDVGIGGIPQYKLQRGKVAVLRPFRPPARPAGGGPATPAIRTALDSG